LDVSAGELLGLAILVGVLTGAGAALLVPLWLTRLRRSLIYQEGRVNACGRWLDARCALSSASKNFITSFRALNRVQVDVGDDEHLRRAEAARESWLRASREWSAATAQLLARWNHPDLGVMIRRFEQPDAQAIRAAIGKSPSDVETLFLRLDELDKEAVNAARRLLQVSPSWWWARVNGARTFVGRILAQWSKPG